MAITQMKRALWMMNELIKSSPMGISREELNRKWSASSFNDNGDEEINKRTFHRLIADLQEIFHIEIVRSQDGNNRYSVEQTQYSEFLGMLCNLVMNNSRHTIGIKDLLLQVMNNNDISDENREMIDDMSFRLNRIG